jgi:hypothetical protein
MRRFTLNASKLVIAAIAILASAGVFMTKASTITVIQGTDTISSSRSVINNNFQNLNNDKVQIGGDIGGTTTTPRVTSLTITGAGTGTLLYYTGSAWLPFPTGTPGYALKATSAAPYIVFEPVGAAAGLVTVNGMGPTSTFSVSGTAPIAVSTSSPSNIQITLLVPLAVSYGGTGTTTLPINNAFLVSDGSKYVSVVMPDCGNATTSKLIYSSSTKALLCATDQNTGGGGTGNITGSGTSTQVALFNTSSSIYSSPNITYNESTGVFTVTATTTIHNLSLTVPLGISSGGTGTSTTPANNAFLIGDGSKYIFTAIPDCPSTSTNKLLFSSSSRSFTCGTDQTISPTGTLNSVRTSSTAQIMYNNTSTYADVSGATTTMSTGASKVLIIAEGHFQMVPVGGVVTFDLAVDDNTVCDATRGLLQFYTGVNAPHPFRITYLTNTLSAASHTFKLKVKMDANETYINVPAMITVIELGYLTGSGITNLNGISTSSINIVAGNKITVSTSSNQITVGLTTSSISQFVNDVGYVTSSAGGGVNNATGTPGGVAIFNGNNTVTSSDRLTFATTSLLFTAPTGTFTGGINVTGPLNASNTAIFEQLVTLRAALNGASAVLTGLLTTDTLNVSSTSALKGNVNASGTFTIQGTTELRSTLDVLSGTIRLASTTVNSLLSADRINATTSLIVAGSAVSTSTGANPTASIGLTVTNGTANTFLRSDAAPALDQSIAPIWTGIHIFSNTSTFNATVNITSSTASRCARFDANKNLVAASGDCASGDTTGGSGGVATSSPTAANALLYFVDGGTAVNASATVNFTTSTATLEVRGVASSSQSRVTSGTITSLVSSNATTTNLRIGSLNGLLKGTSGLVGTAISNVDYQAVITTGTTAQYLRGDLSLATLNQAAVSGLTSSDSPTFAGLTINGNVNISGIASSTQIRSPSGTIAYINATNVTSTNVRIGTNLIIGGDTITELVGTGLTLNGSTLETTLGTSVDISSETNLSGGNYLTLSNDTIDVDPELASSTVSFAFYDATSTKPYGLQKVQIPFTATVAKIWCDEYAGATSTVAIYRVDSNGTTTVSASITSSTLACGIGGNSTTTFTSSTIPANTYILAAVSSTAGTPTLTSVHVNLKKTD